MSRVLKVYLAAPYQMKDVIHLRAQQLRDLGIEVTSSWLDEPHKPGTQMSELTHDQHQVYAFRDVEDVLRADLLVFQDDPTIPRAGRHVEFGIAIAAGSLGGRRFFPIFVVGELRSNIFHHLPQVQHFETWDDVQVALRQLATLASRE